MPLPHTSGSWIYVPAILVPSPFPRVPSFRSFFFLLATSPAARRLLLDLTNCPAFPLPSFFLLFFYSLPPVLSSSHLSSPISLFCCFHISFTWRIPCASPGYLASTVCHCASFCESDLVLLARIASQRTRFALNWVLKSLADQF